MNLVAKEFVIAQDAAGGAGVLLLSEFAGAAEELREALPCNPFDVEGSRERSSSPWSWRRTTGATGSRGSPSGSTATTSSPGSRKRSECSKRSPSARGAEGPSGG